MLTGNYQIFFERAEEFLRNVDENTEYCIAAIDIEHFKLFNEWYGIAAGDKFLSHIDAILLETAKAYSGMAGYLFADDFAIILPHRQEYLEEIQEKVIEYVRTVEENVGFFPAIGVYIISDNKIAVSAMYDRAVIAISSIKGNYANRIAYYQNEMHERLEDEHRLIRDVQNALKNQEFTFYLQPKVNIVNNKIIGAESLVRWIHPVRGLISPGKFIPILEKNGMIGKLDFYIWEAVCKHIRKRLDEGKKVVPISVNLSRVDMYTMNVIDCLEGLVGQYRIPKKALEIEITESAYVEEYDKVKDIITRLQTAGFLVSMDDFGSGYSSLNMLKDINVDILKIDMNFLKMDEGSWNRGTGIIEAIVNMAHNMGLKVIAEGVETEEHVGLLREIGCTLAQGYHYYKPMPIGDFETVVEDESKIESI